MSRKIHFSPHLSLPVDWMTAATVVYGARGSGKTTFGVVAAEEVNRCHQRFCAVDLKGDWWGLKASADGKGEGIPVVIFGGDHADLPLDPAQGALLGELVAGLRQSCVLDLEHVRKADQIRFLTAFFETLYEKNREPLLLILDEAQRYAPQKPMSSEGQACLGAVEDLVKLGRKHGIGPLLITQRGAGLNKEISELCDMLVVFRTPGTLDQARVNDWVEGNLGKPAAVEALAGISKRPKGVAVVASANPDIDVFAVTKIRERQTFDSSATPKVGSRVRAPKRLAKPDLDALRTRLATTIERRKENDPVELKKTIAGLKDQLAQLEKEAAKEKVTTKTIEIPVLDKGDLERLERAARTSGGQARRDSGSNGAGAAGRRVVDRKHSDGPPAVACTASQGPGGRCVSGACDAETHGAHRFGRRAVASGRRGRFVGSHRVSGGASPGAAHRLDRLHAVVAQYVPGQAQGARLHRGSRGQDGGNGRGACGVAQSYAAPSRPRSS